MGQSVLTLDRQATQGTAASGGGTYAPTYAIPTDKVVYLRAHCIVSRAVSSHLNDCAALTASAVFINKNGTVTLAGALTNSNNPASSNTTTYVASDAQASDYNASGVVTLVFSVSTPNAVCTYTNVGNPNGVNVTIIMDAIIVGST
jgi:hypothetical protein